MATRRLTGHSFVGPGQSTEDVKWLDQKLKDLFAEVSGDTTSGHTSDTAKAAVHRLAESRGGTGEVSKPDQTPADNKHLGDAVASAQNPAVK